MRKFCAALLLAATFATPAFAQDAAGDFAGPHIQIVGGVDHVNVGGQSETGAMYGIGAGYDFATSGGAVFGIEGEASLSTVSQCDPSDDVCVQADRDLYIGGRGGFLVHRNVLAYVKAGYTNARAELEDTTGTDLGSVKLDGVRGGMGLEYNGGSPFTVRLEYRYSNYENDVARHQGVLGRGLRF
jgi:outer membrane immunogenic protein